MSDTEDWEIHDWIDYARMLEAECGRLNKVIEGLNAYGEQVAKENSVYLTALQNGNTRRIETGVTLRRYRDALTSISKNGCCASCQEAKLVALAALDPKPVSDRLSAPSIMVPSGAPIDYNCTHSGGLGCPICNPSGRFADEPTLSPVEDKP